MKLKWMTAIAGTALAFLWAGNMCFAQSSDALLNKLVEKGILTSKEADELRQETNPAPRSSTKENSPPEWLESLKFSGDFRLRYDGIYNDSPVMVDRHRLRYRLRFGATAQLSDRIEAGLRLMSGDTGKSTFISGDPISGNSTFGDNGSKKFIGIDLAYLKWSPVETPDWTATFIGGKMENPFTFSEIIFDPDYTPEGFGQQFGFAINSQHAVKLNLGEFILDELSRSSHDPFLLGAQLRLESAWNLKWQTSFGISALMISGTENLLSANVPDQNEGNTRVNLNAGTTNPPVFGAPVATFNPIVLDGEVIYSMEKFPFYHGAFPISIAADYAVNPATDENNQAFSAGITFGKSGKKGAWDFTYKYKYLEADFWFEELVDSDTGASYEIGTAQSAGATGYSSGTNVRGHFLRATFSPHDAVTLSATYFLFNLIQGRTKNSETGRLLLDASVKF